jgi:hypothetical protein
MFFVGSGYEKNFSVRFSFCLEQGFSNVVFIQWVAPGIEASGIFEPLKKLKTRSCRGYSFRYRCVSADCIVVVSIVSD